MPSNDTKPKTKNKRDIDFVDAMQDLLGMDEDAVEQLLDELDADDLQTLTDAVAKQDRAAAQTVVGRFDTDEAVNALFRGKNVNADDKKKTVQKNRDGTAQFGIGDDVLVTQKDASGKTRRVTATVAQPDGPEGSDTIIVRIKGKSKVIDKRNVAKLKEAIIGMVGLPNLNRIQQLAGIQTQSVPQQQIAPPTSLEPAAEPGPDDPNCQALAALDTLEAVLPSITLADLKTLRQRLNAIQAAMNESVGKDWFSGRARKL